MYYVFCYYYKKQIYLGYFCCCCSVTQWCQTLWDPQYTRLPCPSQTPRICLNSCPLSQWCHPTISSSVIPFFSCLQSFPASGSFSMSQFFTSGGQKIGASASVLPMSIRIDLLSLQSKGLSRAFSNTIVYKHKLFSTQSSLKWSNCHIHQFSSVAQSCPTLCDPMNCSTPGLPVHHQLLEFTQTHVHRVSDAI